MVSISTFAGPGLGFGVSIRGTDEPIAYNLGPLAQLEGFEPTSSLFPKGLSGALRVVNIVLTLAVSHPDSPCLGFSAGEGTTLLNNRPLGWVPYFLGGEHTGFELLGGSSTLSILSKITIT